MDLTPSDATCTVGVLDHAKYDEQFLPLIREARGRGGVEAVPKLRAFLMGIGEGERRDDALNQLDRVEVAVQGGRWQSNASGMILEASCVDAVEEVPDLMSMLQTCSPFLYEWNEDHAETVTRFFGFLSDHTIRWASPPDTWRAIVAPEHLGGIQEAMSALTPRELRKLMEAAEDGNVFSVDEAREFSQWWEAIRKVLRTASRLEHGFYICVAQPS